MSLAAMFNYPLYNQTTRLRDGCSSSHIADVEVVQTSSEVRLFSQNTEVIHSTLVSRQSAMIRTRERLNEA